MSKIYVNAQLNFYRILWYTKNEPKIMNVNEIKNKIKSEEPFLRENFRVKKIGIFGSYSRGEQRKSSDIDVLVEYYEAPSMFEYLDLEEFLSKILNGIKVDLVMKNSLKRYIGERILSEVIYI